MTSSASISTQSAAGSPSIRGDPAELLLDPVGELGRHRRDLPRRAAGRDHHMVGDVRLAGERDGDDLDAPGRRRAIAGRGGGGLRRRSAGRPVAAVSVGRSGKWSPDGRWHAETLGTGSGREAAMPVGVERAQAGGGGWVGRQAKEARSPVHSIPSSSCLAARADEPSAASPSRAPRGPRHHSRAGESPQSAPSRAKPRQSLPLVELGHSVVAHQPDEAVARDSGAGAAARVSTCSGCPSRASKSLTRIAARRAMRSGRGEAGFERAPCPWRRPSADCRARPATRPRRGRAPPSPPG